ncbi:MAG: alpha-amylase [Oscillospiraceae bacterium]|nr:alpha-amylase [Oscillospiraceae bacterium]
MKKLLSLLLALLLLSGCASAPQLSKTEAALAEISKLGTSPDDNYRTWYEIFVYSFCDSNGDGIGDLKGVISKLDYLQELGINGIWLMPIHPSRSYHKYDVSNYNAIDPAYGSLDDFRELLAECEERDIHVIMDLVLNHTGSDHHWFTAACDYLRALPEGKAPSSEECPYLDYYYFSQEQEATWYYQVTGTNWYYEGKFSPDMPDLRLENGLVRQEIDAIISYWLGMGVSGFRLDAAKEFYSGNTPMNVDVLSWIQETATAYKEDAYLVAEVWDGFGAVTDYYTSGITSLFDFPFGTSGGKIVTILRNAGNDSQIPTYAQALEKADKAYSGANPSYIDAPFLSNHDVGRIAGFVSRDENKTKLAGAMNLFMSGSAFVYYGEEIGMLGGDNDPSKRAPMYWNAARDNGTPNPPPDCELPESYPFGSLEEQKGNDLSIYNYYRQAIAIRKALPVISHGKTTEEKQLNVGCVSAFRKTWNEESYIILMNIAPEAAAVDLSAYDGWTLAASLSVSEEAVTMEGTSLTLPAYGVAVLTK